MQRCPPIIVCIVYIQTFNDKPSQALKVTAGSSCDSSNNSPNESLMSSAVEIFLFHVLVEKVEVHVDIVELLDHTNASDTVALIIKER